MKKIVYLLMAVAMVMTACSKKDEKKTTAQDEAVKVKIEKVSMEEIDQIYDFTTTVDAAVKNYITSAGGTRIEKIWVEVGQKVSKGQKLVTMENTNLATANAQIDNLKIEVSRMEALYASGGISKQQLDQIKTQYDVAKRNIENLERNITLTSPISGVITMRNFDNGDVSGAQPILQVMQITPVKLKFNINESFYNKIKLGMSVKAKVQVFEDEEFSGKISLIAPTIDPTTRTFMVEAQFSNGNQKLRPGMFGRVELNLGKAKKVIISDKAVIKQSGTNNKYVFIEKNGSVEYRQVELGRRLGDRYELLSGVNDGENVVVSGQTSLLDGKKVIVVK
ncbi:MAG: efflux RND transporter periplasmic adaptor subunit [Bacteroidales bacterium]|nr:efflux RND transporter periplasmic adaptor subunit [Bacteroidales bacterium]MDD4001428.1 efflux RND transporter periplasmic adaptor subunit [Bacteroidales bacterium]MDD4529241.1 efflux RND transporter periplasmic adaptor subunit [Bacteroidales bacterium]